MVLDWVPFLEPPDWREVKVHLWNNSRDVALLRDLVQARTTFSWVILGNFRPRSERKAVGQGEGA